MATKAVDGLSWEHNIGALMDSEENEGTNPE